MTPHRPLPRRVRIALVMVVAAAVGGGGWYAAGRGRAVQGEAHAVADEPKSVPPVAVEVVTPRPGGIDRVCVQPGTVEPFAAADLYAKASGFLAEQAVDIGSRVTKGDVLARIAVPEYDKQVDKDAADVRAAEAKVAQAAAAIVTAGAELGAATATVALSGAEVKSKTSYRAYRLKQRDRLKELLAERAIDAKLVDEQEDQYEAAAGAVLAAQEAVNAAKQKEAAARAKIEQAKADRAFAEAGVAVAKAQLARSAVLLDYRVVRSPYTGVVTKRSFHPGDFVRSADQGGAVPVLAVERTDIMRVVVQVPDRDVPFVSLGDPAVVEIDALPGVVYETRGAERVVVSRWANVEDPATRTMRTEVDVPNPDVVLRHGMYGRVTLTLQTGAPAAVRVPTGAVVGRGDRGKATVRVVRGDRVHAVPVVLGADDGVEVEVLSGLTPADQVIVRAAGPVDDGAVVTIAGATAPPAGH